MKKICVYCGSRFGHGELYTKVAEELATALVDKDIDLVYGGGAVGLMGVIADTVLKKGGKVIGVVPRNLFKQEASHTGLTELIHVDSMHERKATMAELSDGFIALPGGYGTIEEVMEAITWRQLKIAHKPIGFLNVENYYNGLIEFLHHCVEQGFIPQKHKNLFFHHDRSEVLLDNMLATA